MASSSIPNLNTPRDGRRGPRLRGRRGGHNTKDAPSNAENAETGRDRIVQQTDQDASSSRMSALALGYVQDPYAQLFFSSEQDVPKRYPIINRGTYVRTQAIDKLVTRFLDIAPEQRKQIVSLGAGSDTRFFRLCAGKYSVAYHELDFETNVIPKRTAIRASSELSRLTLPHESGSAYHLHALDLRDLTAKSPPTIPHFDADLPTLLLSECCLCYLPPDTATSVLQYFTMHTPSTPLALILYEPIRPFDAFGRTMVSNLASRGIHLQTLQRYGSLEAQRQRLRVAGLSDGQGARDVRQLWEAEEWVARGERERVERLEWLDEVEEWKLLAGHYCVAWGWRGEVFGEAWEGIEGGRTGGEEADAGMM